MTLGYCYGNLQALNYQIHVLDEKHHNKVLRQLERYNYQHSVMKITQ